MRPDWVREAFLRRPAFQCADLAVLIVDASRNLLDSNDAGRELLASRQGLRVVAGRLGCELRQDTQRLARLVADGTAPASTRLNEGTMPVQGADRGPPIGIRVLHMGTIDSVPVAAIVSCIRCPARTEPLAMLSEAFGLSAAETDILRRLIQGEAPTEIAHALGRSIHTVRNHLRSLFRKTGTDGQCGLLRLILRWAPPPAFGVGTPQSPCNGARATARQAAVRPRRKQPRRPRPPAT